VNWGEARTKTTSSNLNLHIISTNITSKKNRHPTHRGQICSMIPLRDLSRQKDLDLCIYHKEQKIAQSMASQSPNLIQSSELPPAQPDYVLRGHTAQIHCVHFLRQNLRLLTGDADGWVVLWNFAVKRPVAVWKAHGGSVLGVGSWGVEEENVITCVCLDVA